MYVLQTRVGHSLSGLRLSLTRSIICLSLLGYLSQEARPGSLQKPCRLSNATGGHVRSALHNLMTVNGLVVLRAATAYLRKRPRSCPFRKRSSLLGRLVPAWCTIARLASGPKDTSSAAFRVARKHPRRGLGASGLHKLVPFLPDMPRLDDRAIHIWAHAGYGAPSSWNL